MKDDGEGLAKFKILHNLGEIVVPNDYEHSSAIASVLTPNKFTAVDEVTDERFPHSGYTLIPGQIIRVSICGPIVEASSTWEERIAYLQSIGSVFPGIRGLLLAWEQKRLQFPIGKYYYALDKKENLWRDRSDWARMPSISRPSELDSYLNLSYFATNPGPGYNSLFLAFFA
jgi:hypothetical protein